MKIRTRLLIGTVVIACGIVGVVLATPLVGVVSKLLSTGTINREIFEHARVALPEVGGETDQNDEWIARFFTSGPSNFIVQDVTIAPGGNNGWHSHPGILLSTVYQGSIEWYNSKCEPQVYNAGDSLTENTGTHLVRNVGTVPAHLMVTYVIAKDQPRRIDQPAPGCAASHGLPTQ
jgi:quercetin dioxygenase-like cupin family protein